LDNDWFDGALRDLFIPALKEETTFVTGAYVHLALRTEDAVEAAVAARPMEALTLVQERRIRQFLCNSKSMTK
jgi:hypothetical protein